MKISTKEINSLAESSALSFTESELQEFSKKLDSIIGFIENIEKLELPEIQETGKEVYLEDLREDTVHESMSIEDFLLNAPQSDDRCLLVPKVVD